MQKNNVNNTFKKVAINSKGFGIISKLFMQDPRLSSESKSIYSYLCAYAGNKNIAFPKVDTILRHVKMGKTRYYNHLKPLIEFGYITVEQVKGPKGKFSHNVYTLNSEVMDIQAYHEDTPMSKNNEFKPISPCPQNRDTDERNTDNRTTNNNNINNNNFKNNKNNNIAKEINKINEKTKAVVVETIKSLIPKEIKLSKKNVQAIMKAGKFNLERIKRGINAFISYAMNKTIKNPIGTIITAIRNQWEANEMKQCNTKSTLKNFDEEEIDFKAIMAIHNKMTAKDIFADDYIDDPVII